MKRLSAGLVALAASAAAATAVVAPACAADLPVAPYAGPIVPPAYYNWTGVYIGGLAGIGLLQDTHTQTATVLQPAGTATNVNPIGEFYGLQVGANYELNSWVVGVEATLMWAFLTGETVGNTLLTPVFGVTERAQSSPKWYASAAARFGYAFNDILLYAKGGPAWMGVNYTQYVLTGGIVVSDDLVIDTRTGFTVGAGLEYGITEHITAKLEYDFYDFDSRSYNFGALSALGVPIAVPISVRSDTHVFLVGLNYRFTLGGGVPVAVRY
jgi:outer membrane immunogenic protein